MMEEEEDRMPGHQMFEEDARDLQDPKSPAACPWASARSSIPCTAFRSPTRMLERARLAYTSKDCPGRRRRWTDRPVLQSMDTNHCLDAYAYGCDVQNSNLLHNLLREVSSRQCWSRLGQADIP
jgi:hypothetical protein